VKQDFLLNADSRDEEECYKISLSREQKQDASATATAKRDLLRKTPSQAVMKVDKIHNRYIYISDFPQDQSVLTLFFFFFKLK